MIEGVRDMVNVGPHTLYHADCGDVLAVIPDGSIDACVTDPPYKMEIHGRGFAARRDYYSALDYGTNAQFVLSDTWLNFLFKKLTSQNAVFFCNKLMKLDLENYAIRSGRTFDELVFCKTAPAPLTNNQWLPDKEFAVHIFKSLPVKGSYRTKRSWHVVSNFQDTTVNHPSAKPVHLVASIIENVTDVGQTVIDPFMGSGSTGLACMATGRVFIGVEREKAHFDEAVARMRAMHSQPSLFTPQTDVEQSQLDFEGAA